VGARWQSQATPTDFAERAMPIQMLTQILSHTPIHVWAILAFLVYRGMIASRDREVEMRKLCIIPIVMLVLSLQDIAAKFGLDGIALAAWAAGMAIALPPVLVFGADRIAAGSTPGTVRIRGSWVPLAMMMAVFFTKYAASVMLAIFPHAHQNALATGVICTLFGLFNGFFVGRLARDLWTHANLQAASPQTACLRFAKKASYSK
jgi:uncharacterized membrane protein